MNILFDLDGTLTDPREGFVASIKHALGTLGCSLVPDDELARHIRPPLEETLRTLLGDNPSRIQTAITLYRERYGTKGFLENVIYPGIEAALTDLYERGVALFVATSKPHVFADRILTQFNLKRFFRAIYGSELDGTHANKGHLIAHLLKREALWPRETVMVGDRAHDMIGAAANGVPSIGVLWGYGSYAELTAAGASAICEDPSLLGQVLSSDPRL